MRRATDILPSNSGNVDDIVGTVTLSYEDRYRRRIKMRDDSGEAFMLDLKKAVQMDEGDALILEKGGMIEVKAAKEDVLDIKCRTASETAKIAWHIGNRHIPLQVLECGAVRIIFDHVLKNMVEGLGAETTPNVAVFSPEKGAYDVSGHSGGHVHGHK